MPIDPQVQRLLDHYNRFGVPPFTTLTPEEARQQPTLVDAARELFGQQGEDASPESVGNVTDLAIPGPGGAVPIRIYRPTGSGPFPALVYIHGGGWVFGNLENTDVACHALTNMAQCLVVSVDYRRAPEHQYPAAVDDAYAAVQWVFENAASIDGDPQRVAVGGESAGGNLATVVCLRARDQGDPLPIYQALIYPVTNYAFDTPSYAENADNPALSRETMRWFWRHYLPDEQAGQQPYASPLRAPDLSGLPPAVIITAEYDPLRDEGEAYAQRLRDAGVPVVSSRYTGMVHLFFRLTALLEPARKALLEVAAGLRSAFSRAPELAQSDIKPLGAVVAAEAQTREGIQVGSLGLEQETPVPQSAEQMTGSELAHQTQARTHERDTAPQAHPQQEASQMTSPTQPPEDIRTPGTPIRPAPVPADERDATQPGEAASESAPVIPPDTRVQESAPIIPTDLDEDQGVAATLPPGAAPRESAPVIPSGKPGQERAPVIPADEGLPPAESVIPADRPQEANAPIIPTDAQERKAAQEVDGRSAPPASEASRDTTLNPE
ncbi:MAG TPA: alpha/beta hydrolase fold domain-containing protein [Ktedonobacterales bacterium]|nr:alpha/beta hydrolase fold domain-containing protein [Ktedonobacterales bacterium]